MRPAYVEVLNTSLAIGRRAIQKSTKHDERSQSEIKAKCMLISVRLKMASEGLLHGQLFSETQERIQKALSPHMILVLDGVGGKQFNNETTFDRLIRD